MKHPTITFLPDGKHLRVAAGVTLFEAARQAGIFLSGPCGGRGTCKKCRVQVGPDGQEELACQYSVRQDIRVSIPAASRLRTHQILEAGFEKPIAINPLWRKIFFSASPDSLTSLCRQLAEEYFLFTTIPSGIEFIPSAYSRGLTVVVYYDSLCSAWRISAVESGNTLGKLVGAAVDIGTTTVVLRLAEIQTGRLLATVSAANPQHSWGDDVISRIEFASTPEGQNTLQKSILDCLNDLLERAAAIAGIQPADIYELTAVGNTTMNHLLLKLPVVQLGQSPYRPYSVDACQVQTRSIGLNMNPAGVLFTLHNIAGFVGSDTLAAAVAAELDKQTQTTLLVDIGTNGELVLIANGKLYTASCAAGPALEGARIRFGSRAMDGAIQSVTVNSDALDIDVIGNVTPKTICGSGLIDALAVLVELGIIDSTGRFRDKDELSNLLPAFAARLIDFEGQPAFVFAYDGRCPAIVLTQADVRQMQLAKAAIRAGIQILANAAEIDEAKIERLQIAGAFGNYIRKSSAVRIGLLPPICQDKIQFIGNAASLGALEILLNKPIRINCQTLARKMQYVELASHQDFQDVYAACLMF